MEIELGHGKYRIEGCLRDGRQGLLIRSADQAHGVNKILPYDKNPHVPGDDETVIWFDNIEGARVLQNQVNVAVLRMDGYEVVNANAGSEGREPAGENHE